jgi:hypothetical protein
MSTLATLPYPLLQSALNIAIAMANDAGSPAGLSGSIYNPETNPAVIPMFQNRYQFIQQQLISAGADTFDRWSVVMGCPASATADIGTPMELTYNGFYNGVTFVGPNISASAWNASLLYVQGNVVVYGTNVYIALTNAAQNINQNPSTSPTFWSPFDLIGPALPPDLLKPLEIFERISGTTGPWAPMRQAPDEIGSRQISQRFGVWSFVNDRLLLPPANQTIDLRIHYIHKLPDISSVESPLMIVGCETTLALLFLDAMTIGRGGEEANIFKERATESLNLLINQTVRKMAFSSYTRKPFRSSRNRGRGRGW